VRGRNYINVFSVNKIDNFNSVCLSLIIMRKRKKCALLKENIGALSPPNAEIRCRGQN
jgi:hypothetical protein